MSRRAGALTPPRARRTPARAAARGRRAAHGVAVRRQHGLQLAQPLERADVHRHRVLGEVDQPHEVPAARVPAAPGEDVRVVDGQQLRLPRRVQRGQLAPHPGEPLDPAEHPPLDAAGVVAAGGRVGVEPRPVHPPVVLRERRVVEVARVVVERELVAHVEQRHPAPGERDGVQQHVPADPDVQRRVVAALARLADPAQGGAGAGDAGVAGLGVVLEQRAAGVGASGRRRSRSR